MEETGSNLPFMTPELVALTCIVTPILNREHKHLSCTQNEINLHAESSHGTPLLYNVILINVCSDDAVNSGVQCPI